MNEYSSRDSAMKFSKKSPLDTAITTKIIYELTKCYGETSDESVKFQFMLDVGCGSGRSTRAFSPNFNSILGFDVSSEQIKLAQEMELEENVAYVVGNSDAFPCDDKSVDLVTSCFSLHFMDVSKFVDECERVLKPKGMVAAYGFVISDIELENGDIDLKSGYGVFQDFYFQPLTDYVKKMNHPEQHVCDRFQALYNGIDTKLQKWRDDKLKFEIRTNFKKFKEDCMVVPIFQKFSESFPVNAYDTLFRKLKKYWEIPNIKNEDVAVKITFSLFSIFMKK
uniref:probable S-adenosylmethionine-dependent methyltransferase CRG1 n=1 Tax=Styela clava TaxID=7725 RepID=UPI00193A35F8|nr:probable S-adenosylmethionine-dependent methyltransferase CRG1 [Styela clava]